MDSPEVAPQPGQRDRRRHPGVAALVALTVFAVGVVLSTLSNMAGVVYMQSQTLQSLDGLDYAAPAFWVGLSIAVNQYLPFALGVFGSLWLIAPIRASQRLGGAVGRILLATLIGTAVSFVVYTATGIASNLSALNPGAGNDIDPRYYLMIAGGVVNQTWQILASGVVLVAAAGFAAWGWLKDRRNVEASTAMPDLETPTRDTLIE